MSSDKLLQCVIPDICIVPHALHTGSGQWFMSEMCNVNMHMDSNMASSTSRQMYSRAVRMSSDKLLQCSMSKLRLEPHHSNDGFQYAVAL